MVIFLYKKLKQKMTEQLNKPEQQIGLTDQEVIEAWSTVTQAYGDCARPHNANLPYIIAAVHTHDHSSNADLRLHKPSRDGLRTLYVNDMHGTEAIDLVGGVASDLMRRGVPLTDVRVQGAYQNSRELADSINQRVEELAIEAGSE
jgi:hypothetical protein